MYDILLLIHSYVRWLVLISLLVAIGRSAHGWWSGRTYQPADASTRTLTITFSHLQFLLGLTLYTISPITTYFMAHAEQGAKVPAISFFALRHPFTMLVAVTVLTIGGSLAKRARPDNRKFRLTTIYFLLALVLIGSAVPWPFLEQAARPWFRLF